MQGSFGAIGAGDLKLLLDNALALQANRYLSVKCPLSTTSEHYREDR